MQTFFIHNREPNVLKLIYTKPIASRSHTIWNTVSCI